MMDIILEVRDILANGNVPTVSQITYIVNGGQNNLGERMDIYNLILNILK